MQRIILRRIPQASVTTLIINKAGHNVHYEPQSPRRISLNGDRASFVIFVTLHSLFKHCKSF